MSRYRRLTKEEWLEYGAKARKMKKLLNELKNMQIPVKMREPYLITAWKSIFRICFRSETEMIRQHPDMVDPYHVFSEGKNNWD